MRILITNDDGITAPGIKALIETFREGNDITVVAPDTQRSAVSHACTFWNPIRVSRFGEQSPNFVSYAVNGTPVDCVFWAIFHLMKENPPELILSGVNSGANMGYDVMYSGTVAAAMEGAIHGFKSIAVSSDSRSPVHFDTAAKLAKCLVSEIFGEGSKLEAPIQTLFNLNVPDLPIEDIKGIKLTNQGLSIYNQYVVHRRDPWERDYYWLSGDQPQGEALEGSDFAAVLSEYASLTPIQIDCTNYQILKMWRDKLGGDTLKKFDFTSSK